MIGRIIKLSAVIITFNEEKQIRQCLESVSWVEEIVVVDSFSNDATVEIAKNYTDRIFQNEFKGHIEQKNYALSLSRGGWILAIDADEIVSEDLKNEIHQVIKTPSSYDGYFIKRENHYLGKRINHSGWNPDYKLRLFKKGSGVWGGTNPHDSIILKGKSGYLKSPVIHFSYNNLSEHFSQIDFFTSISASEYFKDKRKCSFYHLLFLPFITLIKKLIFQGAFLDGARGIIISASTVFYQFLKYAKLWELNENDASGRKTENPPH